MSSLFGFNTSVCGLDVGLHALMAAQLKSPAQHSTLVCLSTQDLDQKTFEKDKTLDSEILARTLKNLISNAQPRPITAKAVVAALPETYIFTKIIQLPNLAPKELQKAIGYEASQYLPVPIDEVYFDYTPLALRPDNKQIDAALFAAPKNLVDSLITAIKSCGLELYAVETKSTAIGRALLPSGNTDAVLIIDIGSESTRMTLVDHGNVWLATSVAIGEIQMLKALSELFKCEPKEVRKIVAAGTSDLVKDTIKSITAGITQEAMSVIRYHETRDYGPNKVAKALVVGQGATIPGILDQIVEAIHLKSEFGAPLVAGNKSIDLRYTVALGLSMRSL